MANEPDWIKTGLTFFALFLLYKVDFTQENNVLLIRILFGFSQLVTFALIAYLYFKISPIPEGGPKTVKNAPKASFFETPDPTNIQYMSVKEYDLSQLKALLSSTAMTIGITAFIHIKFGLVPPLLMQGILAISTLYGNPMFQAYVLGKDLPRPFPEPPGLFSGLSAAFSGEEAKTEEPKENILEVEDENEDENQEAIEGKKEKKQGKKDKKEDGKETKKQKKRDNHSNEEDSKKNE